MFNIIEIVEACCKYIEKQLHPSNCLGIHKFAVQHDLNRLTETAWNYILVKFFSSFFEIILIIEFFFC
jgi:kelch-like protein 1/4/5